MAAGPGGRKGMGPERGGGGAGHDPAGTDGYGADDERTVPNRAIPVGKASPSVKGQQPGRPTRTGPRIEAALGIDSPATGGDGSDAGVPEPRPFAPGDIVPLFRADLEARKLASGGQFEVTDPATGRHFTLYEFEVSIARMLDGRRHASDVVESGVRLGIPVDLDGLYKFVRQLWRYGFLAGPGAVAAPRQPGESGWPRREKWDEATRSLFQSGVRLVRQGRPEDARSYLEAVLDADPANSEAEALLAAIRSGRARSASPVGKRRSPAALLDAARSLPRRTVMAVAAIMLAVAAGTAGLMARQSGRAAPAVQAPPQAPVAPAVPPGPPAPAVPAIATPPPPEWRTAAVRRRAHPALKDVAAPAGGTIVWKRKDGSRVSKGDRIGVVRTSVAVQGPVQDPASAARIKELEALASKDPVYRDFLEKERLAAKRKRPAKAVREVPVVAPASGMLSRAVEDGARVQRGATVASIGDGRVWVLAASLDGGPPAAEAACELRGDGVADRAGCRLEAGGPDVAEGEINVAVRASDAPWLERSSSLVVRVAPPGTSPEGRDDSARNSAP